MGNDRRCKDWKSNWAALAQAAGRRLFEGARDQAKARAKDDFQRLDKLTDTDIEALRGRELLVVFLHGLFGTDLATFDGFIERLYATNPLTLADRVEQQALHAKAASVTAARWSSLLSRVPAWTTAERADLFSKADTKKADRLAKAYRRGASRVSGQCRCRDHPRRVAPQYPDRDQRKRERTGRCARYRLLI